MNANNSEYELLLQYSEIMTRKNVQGFTNNILNAHDFVAMAYEMNFVNYDQAIKIIRTLIITEKRRLIGSLQSKFLSDRAGEKTCRCCKQNKSFQEFRMIIDYRVNFKYFNRWCNDCQRLYDNSDRRKEQRKTSYANSPKQRRQARIRYERFRDKKKVFQQS